MQLLQKAITSKAPRLARSFRNVFTSEPIVYETKMTLPYSQAHFYNVVSDVEQYSQFVPYMTKSSVFNRKAGQFSATTHIGYSSVEFEYESKVTYKEPSMVLSQSTSDSKVFSELYSLWRI